MKQIFARLTAETPLFFKKLRIIGVGLAGTGTAIVAIGGIPEKLSSIAGQMIWIGGVIAAVSQLTCTTPPQTKSNDTTDTTTK